MTDHLVGALEPVSDGILSHIKDPTRYPKLLKNYEKI